MPLLPTGSMGIVEMEGLVCKPKFRFWFEIHSKISPANKRFALVRVDADGCVVSTKLMVLRRIQNELCELR